MGSRTYYSKTETLTVDIPFRGKTSFTEKYFVNFLWPENYNDFFKNKKNNDSRKNNFTLLKAGESIEVEKKEMLFCTDYSVKPNEWKRQ